MGIKLMNGEWFRRCVLFATDRGVGWLPALMLAAMTATVAAQGVSTTTVQGTVYLANGQPGAGTLVISWPAFTTAAGQAVAADSTTVAIAPDGFVSVNLAPNQGAVPAGEYYTAVYYMSDGSTSTQYWVVPAAASATLAQVQAQLMPAAQAVQAVSKAYVDESIAELAESELTASGGTLSGPLFLSGDPTQALEAADKHYVDTQVATAVPIAGGNMTGALTAPSVNGVEAPAAASAQTTLQAAMNASGTNGAMEIPPNYAGTDTFTNTNGVRVTDWRTTGSQQAERSVKEFGAVCDGATDDTNALQAALNYANAHGVALTIPEGTCKTRSLNWRGESIGGLGKQVSSLMGFPGQDVLASGPDAVNMLSYTRLHDLTIYVDQSVDVSCSPAEGRAPAGSCQVSRAMETNSILSPGANGLSGTAGTGAGWWAGNCAIAMQAATGAGGNGLKVAEIENVEIAATGVDPMAAEYPGAHSTHTCGMYLAQWPQWSEFRNIDMRGLNTGVAIPALPVTAPAGLNADSNRWQNVTIQATHAFTAAAGSNNVLDNVVALAGNSSATGEPPTGLVLDLDGNALGWTVRNTVVMPTWNAIQPTLTVTAGGGAVTAVTVGSEHGLGWDPYGTSVPVAFSGSCTALATAAVNANGSIASVTVAQGGVGCSATTTASVNAAGTWDTAAPVNLIGGQDMTFYAGNLLKGNGGYTVWNAANSASYGTQLDGGGGTLPGGGAYAALVGNSKLGPALAVDQFPGPDIGAKIQACVNAVNGTYGGTCDARNFAGILTMGSNLTIATSNVAVLLPCATIVTADQIVVTAGTQNVSLRGCALRGGTAASGSQGGTVLAYSGAGAMVQVGDPAYATDTPGFHMDNLVINTSAAANSAQGLVAYRTQELDLESLYFLGNYTQTGMTLDGTGNYTGGTILDNEISGFGTAVNAIGHQVANPATTDWMNASTFVRVHIDCPTINGSPMNGTYGINLQQGDGNTFTGGDVEGCATALHLGTNAQNNTIVGLRNENSTSQVVADAGSSYNNWITGGTMFTGELTDNGTHNSFWDAFHRSFNNLNGDLWRSQADSTITDHVYTGIGLGNVRGRETEYQTDAPGTPGSYQNAWLVGVSDGTGGSQSYQIEDLLNQVNRISVSQYNNGSSTNNQTLINAAGSGAVVLNGSTNSGTGGVIFGSGGSSGATAAAVSSAGNAQFNGTLLVGGTSQSTGTMTVRNNADAEVDYYLWPGLTTSQKGSYTYKDWNGNSQWYMVKDASNNWALNSATGGLDSFKAYQSTNSGDTYIDASNSTGHVRLNYESGSGAETDIYSGSSANLDAAFLGPASIKFPGLAATSGHFCLQVDTSGYLSNTGAACGSGSGGTSGTINSGNSGQIAYYTSSGTTIGGMNAVPLASGGTGATSASGALVNLGALPVGGGTLSGPLYGTSGKFSAGTVTATTPVQDIRAYGAVIDGATPIDGALQSAINSCPAYSTGAGGASCTVLLPCGGEGCYLANGSSITYSGSGTIDIELQGLLRPGSTFVQPFGTNLIGQGGGTPVSFQRKGPVASVLAPQVAGTLGTGISSTNTPVTFAPTFTSGTIANLPVNSAITVAGQASCTASATRVTSGSQANYTGNVKAVCSSYARMPQGTLVTASNCSDSSFDGTFPIISSDYTAQTITWNQAVSASTATGCTLTGFNDDSFETVRITAVNGSTATATFLHAHSGNDQWGMAAIAPPQGSGGEYIENISVIYPFGAGFWAEGLKGFDLENFGVQTQAVSTATSVELDSSWWMTIRDSSLINFFTNYCSNYGSAGCIDSYPQSIHCSSLPASRGGGATGGDCGFFKLEDSVVMGGIKMDTGGYNASISPSIFVSNVVDEQPNGPGLLIDNRYGAGVPYSDILDAYFPQDELLGTTFKGSPFSQVGYTDAGYMPGNVSIRSYFPSLSGAIENKYFTGEAQTDNADQMALTVGRGVPVGTTGDQGSLDTELAGEDASFPPAVIPYSTLTVATAVSSWSTLCASTSCTVTAVLAPDGSATAGEIDQTASGNVQIQVGQYTGPTSVGDCFIYGGHTRAGANETYNSNPFELYSTGTDVFANSYAANISFPGAFGMDLLNYWWHPQIALVCLSGGDATPHNVNFNLLASGTNGAGTQFFDPFFMYIPASAGIPLNEVERWRQQLLHAYVPSGFTGPGIAVDPNFALVANDFNGQLSGDVTGTQAATSVVKVNGGFVPASASILGTNSSGQPVAATAAQIVSAIGATAVSNAAAATNFSGSLGGDVTGTQSGTSVVKIHGGSVPASANILGTNSSSQPVSEETDLGALSYNASGTTTFAASSSFIAGAKVTATHSTSTTFSPTGLVKWGSYTLEIIEDSTGGGVTFTLGTGGACSAWKVGGGGSGAIALSTTANAIDVLAFTYDGTNCIANFRANFD